MSQAADWLVIDDQPKVLIDLTGFTEVNDRSGITVAAFDAYDPDTRVRQYTDNDGLLEGGLHVPAERGAPKDRGMDWWGFNIPLLELPKEPKQSTVARAGAGGTSGAGAPGGGIGGVSFGGSIGLNVGLGLSGGGSRTGAGFIGVGKRGAGALGFGGLGGNLFGNPGIFGLGGGVGGIQIVGPQMPNAGGGGAGGFGLPGAGGRPVTGSTPPAARQFLPVIDMNWRADNRLKQLTMAQKAVAFPFCAPDPTAKTKTPPTGKKSAGPVGAGPASRGFAGPHNINEYSAPWPGNNPVLMVRGTAEGQLDYLAFRPWQNVLIAHHRGETNPEYSTRLVDINDLNRIDAEKIAGLHTGLKVEESWGEHCGVSLFWGVREKDEEDVGRGLFTTSGEFGRNRSPDAQFMGYAAESGGGPITGGAPDGDKHFVGRNRKGTPINQGHLWLKAPWYFSQYHDAPPEFNQTQYLVDGFSGRDWPVFLKYDDNPLHDILGVNATPGQTRKGLMRWTTPMPFLILPDPDPDPPLEDPIPPWWLPLPPDDFLKPPKLPEPNEGAPVPLFDPIGLTTQFDLVRRGLSEMSAPTDEYEESADEANVFFRTKYLNPRPIGLNFGETFSRNCLKQKTPKEFVKRLRNLGSAISHWNEQRPTTFAFRPVHRGQVEAGLNDLRYTRELSKRDEERVARSPVALRADAWGAERGHGFDYSNDPGFGRNAWGDIAGGLCFYPSNEGLLEQRIGELISAIVAFKNVSIDLACPITEGDNAGGTKDGFSFRLNPSRDVLAIARKDATGQAIENTSIDADGDFQTAGDVETGRAFKDPSTFFAPPGSTSAVAGQTVLVLSALGAGTVNLPDPTALENFGAYVTVKDYDGNASTNNITVSTAIGRIDGSSSGTSEVIDTDLRSVKFKADGTNWVIVADTDGSGGSGLAPGTIIDTLSIETASFNAAFGTSHAVKAAGGAYTSTLPAITASDDGKVIEISDLDGGSGVNNITIDAAANGSTILGGATAKIQVAYNTAKLRAVYDSGSPRYMVI